MMKEMDDKRDESFPILAGLLSPADLRGFNSKQLKALADEIRRAILETVTETGGHCSSNLGVVELTIALHRVFDFQSDRLLWDVGHQAYPHKLLTGRFQSFPTLRTLGGISGFPDPKESSYDIAKVGHSSTALSTGLGVAEGYRRRGQNRKTVVVVGDGALTGGMCFEAFINAGDIRSDLLVVLNDNGNFIDQPVGALHQYFDRIRSGRMYNSLRDRLFSVLQRMPWAQSLEKVAEHTEAAAKRLFSPGFLFEDLGLRYFGPVDGHDQAAVEKMLKRVSHLREPVLVHVHTEKGGGWAPAEADPLTFHGPKGFDPETGEFFPKAASRDTYSQVFAQTLGQMAEADERIVAVTAAMPSGTGLRSFGQKFPGRCYDVGICEQHSFGFVQGLIVAGLRPVLAHYSTFAQRGYDQFFQEFIVQRDLGAVMVLDRAGLVGEDGETHQGLYDIAWSRTLPGTVLCAPRDGAELSAMLRWAHTWRLDDEGRAAAVLIRYPKESIPDRDWGVETAPIELGKAQVLKAGSPGGPMVWTYGVMADRAIAACERLGSEADSVCVVDARFAKPVDAELLEQLAADHPVLITAEDHALAGGFGSCMAEAALDLGLQLKVQRLGVRDELVSHASRSQQLADQGLDVHGLEDALRRALGLTTRTIRFTTKTG
jgi:1-deoxy-D-xylulose-5-phosphate synthase